MVEYSRDSSFNMGIAHLTRIDALLYAVSDYASEDNYVEWHNALCLLSREVFFLFNAEEMKESAQLDNDCANAISNYKIEKSIEAKTIAYNCLINYEFFVKQQLAQRKMLMAFNRDVRSAISDLG